MLEAACWAHVRRKFVDLHELHKSTIAAETIERIGELYAVEKTFVGDRPTNAARPGKSEAVRDSQR